MVLLPAFGAVELFGVSFALGAFFAGVVLNEPELSHRATHDMLLRYCFLSRWACFILLGKLAAAIALVKLFGLSLHTSLTIAVSLAQIGKFAFILAGLGIALNLLSEQGRHLALAGAILSIMINPLMFALLERYLTRYDNESDASEPQQEENAALPPSISHHALLVSYSCGGSLIGARLLQADVPMVVVENTRARVDALRDQGINVVLGNAARAETMTQARLDTSRWLLVTVPNGFEAVEIVALAREQHPDLTIIVRAHHRTRHHAGGDGGAENHQQYDCPAEAGNGAHAPAAFLPARFRAARGAGGKHRPPQI